MPHQLTLPLTSTSTRTRPPFPPQELHHAHADMPKTQAFLQADLTEGAKKAAEDLHKAER